MIINEYEVINVNNNYYLGIGKQHDIDLDWEDYPFAKYGVAQVLLQCTHLNDYKMEHGYIFALDENDYIKGYIEFQDWETDSVTIDMKTVAFFLLSIGAVSFIFCHNHPTDGEDEDYLCSASKEDIRVVGTLFSLADILGIELQDSLIFTQSFWRSMWEGGGQNPYCIEKVC